MNGNVTCQNGWGVAKASACVLGLILAAVGTLWLLPRVIPGTPAAPALAIAIVLILGGLVMAIGGNVGDRSMTQPQDLSVTVPGLARVGVTRVTALGAGLFLCGLGVYVLRLTL